MQDRKSPTLIDVAKQAGVSTATVSRCLNQPSALRAETRRRVEAAVDALGYTPHFGGQALASNRTNTIGAVIPTMENAIFARGLQALEEKLAEAGVTLLVASSGYDPDREEAQIRALIRRGVDGLLLIGQARPERTYELLSRQGTPVVLAWCLPKPGAPRSIGFDNRGAAAALAAAVLAEGHREIAMISGVAAWNDRVAERVAGVRAALASAGLDLPPHRLVEARYTIQDGDAAFRQVLAAGDERPTAVICGNDVLAAGALRAARALSLEAPRDVSITGFDDIDLADAVHPGLTTVRVPHRRMGRLAAETLLALRDGVPITADPSLETSIVRRGSLGPPAR